MSNYPAYVESRWNANRGALSKSIFVTQEQSRVIDGPDSSGAVHDDLSTTQMPTRMGLNVPGSGGLAFPSFKKAQPTQLLSKPSEETNTLSALASNLSWCTPLTGLEALFFIVSAFRGQLSHKY